MRGDWTKIASVLVGLAALAWTTAVVADNLPEGASEPNSGLVTPPTLTPEGGAGSGGLMLTPDVLHALVELHRSGGVGDPAVIEPIKALLFKNNRTLNRARLLGWISNELYQTAQNEFAKLNESFGSEAAREVGAEFAKQLSTAKCYQPGTDSDYITKVHSPEQIKGMQAAYNRRINDYLGKYNLAEGQSRWEALLDTDFMGDPVYVTDLQFDEIADLNNDAYRRRLAAEYERVSRAKPVPKITPDLVREYANEMLDFIKKKQDKIAHYNEELQAAVDPTVESDLYRSMMQEQKYIDRINGANDAIRAQNGLPAMQHGLTSREGFIFSRTPSTVPPAASTKLAISELGAKRGPENIGKAVAASSVAKNSVERALSQLAETYAEAARTNADFAATAGTDIATISATLSTAQKGALIERIRLVAGDDVAVSTARTMRTAASATDNAAAKSALVAAEQEAQPDVSAEPQGIAKLTRPFDEALQKALGVNNDLRKLGPTRQQFNLMATQWMPRVNAMLNLYFIGKETVESGTNFRDYVFHIAAAMDSNTPDAVAQQHLAAAQQLAIGMGLKGGLGAGMLGLMEAFPTVGAVIGSFTAGYQSGRWVLENTATGKAVDRVAGGVFDAAISGGESLSDMLDGWTGGETRAMRERRERNDLLTAYAKAFQRGQFRLREGVELGDLVEAVLRGDTPSKIETLIAPSCSCPIRVRFGREPFRGAAARPHSCAATKFLEAQGEWDATCNGMAKTLPSKTDKPKSEAEEMAAAAMKAIGRGTDAIQVHDSLGGTLTLKLDEAERNVSLRIENDAAHGGDTFVMVPGLRPFMVGEEEFKGSLNGGDIVQGAAAPRPTTGRVGAATIKADLQGNVSMQHEGDAPRTILGEGKLALDVREGSYFYVCKGTFWIPRKP